MATVNQVRGAILEEIVLKLLRDAGYRTIEADEEEIRNGSSGLKLQGRGEWHQVDALVSYDFTPAFIYPIRLIVEAKAYLDKYNRPQKVGIDVVRNAVGVLKDVNENYFSFSASRRKKYKYRRFNYVYAIFSLGGFTEPAQRYAIAHQIFLIQYKNSPLFNGIRECLCKLNKSTVNELFRINPRNCEFKLSEFRKAFRDFLDRSKQENLRRYLTELGLDLMNDLKQALAKIKSSYFGLLNGEYPIHLFSEHEIPADLFRSKDEYDVRISVTDIGTAIVHIDNHVKLEFELPENIAELIKLNWENKIKVAKLKRQCFGFITLTGKIGGIQRNIILLLDREWLSEYIKKLKSKKDIIQNLDI